MILNPEKIDYKRRNLDALGLGKKKNIPISRKFDQNMDEDKRDLWQCYHLWDRLADLRTRRLRANKFIDGDQWSDKFYDPESRKWITGEEYIRSQGRVPLVQNLIKPVINNIKGQYRSYAMKGTVTSRTREKQSLGYTMSAALDAELDYNMSVELDAQNIEELAKGVCVSKVQWDYDDTLDQECLHITNPIINRMFFNSDIEDIRVNKAIRIIGEFHDWPLDVIISKFSQSKAEEEMIRSFYSVSADLLSNLYSTFSSDRVDNLSFLLPNDMDKGRVFEIWQKKLVWRMRVHDPVDGSIQVVNMTEAQLNEMNRQRVQNATAVGVPEESVPLLDWVSRPEMVWFVKYLTPDGHRLYEKESPYKHQSHPYVVTVKSLVDGKVTGLVEDMIPLQVSINRMVTMRDFIIGNSAKGLLMVPEGSIPAGMNINDFAAEWSKANGVIVYKPLASGQVPQQITNNSVPVGINEQISLSMQLFFQVSGITQAAQGMKASAGTPAALYAQEAQNSTINIKDFMARFTSHKIERDYKAIQLIQQFRKDPYYIDIAGKDIPKEARMYNPEEIKNVKFNYSVTESQDTPMFRQAMETELSNLLMNKFIDIKMYLENSSHPWADRLLDAITKREGQQPTPEEMQQLTQQATQSVNQNVNPKAAQMINQFSAGMVA